jgi:hypothetical protein
MVIRSIINGSYLNIDLVNNVKGNINFINYENKYYILNLGYLKYRVIKIPEKVILILNIILKYKKNKNSNLYKIIKYNDNMNHYYKKIMDKIYKNSKLYKNLMGLIGEYLLDNEISVLYQNIIEHDYKNVLIECLMNMTIYKNKQNIKILGNNEIIVIIPDIYFINFINVIKKNDKIMNKFYNDLFKIYNESHGYYIYY